MNARPDVPKTTSLPMTWELNIVISDSRVCLLEKVKRKQAGDLDVCLTYSIEKEGGVPTVTVLSANPKIIQRLSTPTLYEIERLLKDPEVIGESGIQLVLW